VAPLAYQKAQPRSHRLEPGATNVDAWDIRASRSWYDFAVTGALGFRRRFAGHGEDGRPSISDPLLGRQV
jgi:phospholipase C